MDHNKEQNQCSYDFNESRTTSGLNEHVKIYKPRNEMNQKMESGGELWIR